MRPVPARGFGDVDRGTFAACLASILEVAADKVPLDERPEPFTRWRNWLNGRGLGLVPIDGAVSFNWAGYWIARGADEPNATAKRSVVMFNAPAAGLVWDPLDPEAVAPPSHIDDSYLLAPLDVVGPPASPATSNPTRQATVEAIYIAPRANVDMVQVQTVTADERGLEGDRYAHGTGHFSDRLATGQALTLVEAEVLEDLTLPNGNRLDPAHSRRNVVTRGISLDTLIGRHFAIGEVVCFGQRPCEPCVHLEGLTQPGVMRALIHRGGLRADIVRGGTLRTGDRLHIRDEASM